MATLMADPSNTAVPTQFLQLRQRSRSPETSTRSSTVCLKQPAVMEIGLSIPPLHPEALLESEGGTA
jgi:hypothetical protein